MSEIFFTAAFTLEAALKVVGHGFVLHRNAYLRSPWNCLDFLVVVSAILSLSLGGIGIGTWDRESYAVAHARVSHRVL